LVIVKVFEITTALCFPTYNASDDFSEANKMFCVKCGASMHDAGGMAHSTFFCEKVQHLPKEAFDRFGPGTDVNINISWDDFNHAIEEFDKNPIHRKASGTQSMVIRMAYMAQVINFYGSKKINRLLDQKHTVSERVNDTSILEFDPTDWLKNTYWKSKKKTLRDLKRQTKRNRAGSA